MNSFYKRKPIEESYTLNPQTLDEHENFKFGSIIKKKFKL